MPVMSARFIRRRYRGAGVTEGTRSVCFGTLGPGLLYPWGLMTCPSCGADAPLGARFCPSCGQALAVRSDERRVVTVVFGDLVGFTTLSEARDPEQVKNIVDRSFESVVKP